MKRLNPTFLVTMRHHERFGILRGSLICLELTFIVQGHGRTIGRRMHGDSKSG